MSPRDWQALLANTDQLVNEVEDETTRQVAAVAHLPAKPGQRSGYAVSWSDVAATATILPKLESAGLELIAQRLGYLPHDSRIQPQEAFIRALLHRQRTQPVAETVFLAQVDDAVRAIRNADMEPDTTLDYPAAAYARYDTYLPEYRAVAQARLARFLGYVPALRHSLASELWLRQNLAGDMLHLPADAPTSVDHRAVTQIKYREVLLAHGKPAADASPLPGLLASGTAGDR